MTKTEIQNIITSIRKAEGDYITSVLPGRLKENGFKTFYIDECLLTLKAQTDAYTLIINIRHELNEETDEFKMWISKPMYYSDIDLNPENREESRIYTICVLEILDNKTFYNALRSRLKSFDKQMISFKKDLQNAEDDTYSEDFSDNDDSGERILKAIEKIVNDMND